MNGKLLAVLLLPLTFTLAMGEVTMYLMSFK